MLHKHPATVTVSAAHISDWSTKPTYALDWAVQKNFVRTVRAVELLLGVYVPGCSVLEGTPSVTNLGERLAEAFVVDALGLFTPPVVEALGQSFPILLYTAQKLEWTIDFTGCQEHSLITTKFVFPFSVEVERLTVSRFQLYGHLLAIQ